MPRLPLADYPIFDLNLPQGAALTRALAPYYLDWLEHPAYDDYWKRWSIEEHYADIRVPVLTVSAWYDIFQRGSLRNYANLQSRHPENRHLAIAIGGHAGSGRKIGALDFGPAAAEFNETEITLHWYDYLFQRARNEFAGKPVRIFVMGENRWREEEEWPLARARSVRYYLHAGGTLTERQPEAEPPDRYVYDPADPVPTLGGPLCCDARKLPAGPRDQRPVEARPDVLVYSTPPAGEDLEVTGPVTADLFVALIGCRHGFHGQAGGCVAGWIRPEPDRWHCARALPAIGRHARLAKARRGVPGDDRSGSHQQCLQEGPSPARRD